MSSDNRYFITSSLEEIATWLPLTRFQAARWPKESLHLSGESFLQVFVQFGQELLCGQKGLSAPDQQRQVLGHEP